MLMPLFVPWRGGVLLSTLTVTVLVVSGERPRAQHFLRTPGSLMVSPGDTVVLPCLLENKGGQCRWEKDGLPVGLFAEKYRMVGGREGRGETAAWRSGTPGWSGTTACGSARSRPPTLSSQTASSPPRRG